MAATSPVSAMAPERKKKRYRQDIVKENIEVWLMMLPVLVIIFIFSYIPLWGVIIAFQDYQPGSPFFDTANWVGLKHIQQPIFRTPAGEYAAVEPVTVAVCVLGAHHFCPIFE